MNNCKTGWQTTKSLSPRGCESLLVLRQNLRRLVWRRGADGRLPLPLRACCWVGPGIIIIKVEKPLRRLC